MIKKIMMLIMLIIISSSALAITKPLSVGLQQDFLSFEQPLIPGTGVIGECSDYWSIKEERCDGSLSFYMQCFKTASGGVWQQMSIDCAEQPNVQCLGGKCVKTTQITTAIIISLITIIVLILLIFFLVKKIIKPRRRRKK